jgi:hypothetical protein
MVEECIREVRGLPSLSRLVVLLELPLHQTKNQMVSV